MRTFFRPYLEPLRSWASSGAAESVSEGADTLLLAKATQEQQARREVATLSLFSHAVIALL